MKNAILSIIIFFSLLICIFFLNNSVVNLCDSIIATTDDLEIMLLNGDYDTAYEKSTELLNSIEKNIFSASIYVNHQDYDILKYETAKLCIYISKDDISEAFASLHYIKYGADTIKDLQNVTIGNIF